MLLFVTDTYSKYLPQNWNQQTFSENTPLKREREKVGEIL